MTYKERLGLATLIGFILVIIFAPLIPVFAINCFLAAMSMPEVPYTFGTWFGSFIITIMFGPTARICRK